MASSYGDCICSVQYENQINELIEDNAKIKTLASEKAVFECTSLCSGKMYSFYEAQGIAQKHFSDSDGITAFLDVKRTRLSNIQPLPIRIKDDTGWHFEEIISNEGWPLVFIELMSFFYND